MNLIWLLRTPLATAFVLTYGYLNDFGRLVEGPPTISAHACVILRSLEWLAHSLIDNVNDISAKDAATLLEEPERQDSPLAKVLRGMLIWTQRLEHLKKHLEIAPHWGTDDQLRASKFYLDYSYQTSSFLASLGSQATEFNHSDGARSLTLHRIQDLYLTHYHVAAVLYRSDAGISRLLDDRFPSQLDQFWLARKEIPRAGSHLGDYVRKYDLPLSTTTCGFRSASLAWKNPSFSSLASSEHCGMYTQENAMLLQKDKSRHGVVGGDALPADPNAKFWQPQPEISVQARPQLSLPPVETRVKPAVGTVKPEATAAATDELPLPPASQS